MYINLVKTIFETVEENEQMAFLCSGQTAGPQGYFKMFKVFT